MESSLPVDPGMHRSMLRDAVLWKRNDLADLAVRYLHNPPGQEVDLSMVNDALLQEYQQLVRAKVESSDQFPNGSSHNSSPATSIRSGDSAASKSSQASYDPRDIFDQVINSMIERLTLVMPAVRGTSLNRLVGKDRSRRNLFVAELRSFRDTKLTSHFGMSDAPRRRNLGSNKPSKEYLRRRDVYYTEILAIQDQLFRMCEDRNTRRKETLQEDEAIEVRSKLKTWGNRLIVMTEQMRSAPFVDPDGAPEAQMSDAMEVDET